MTEESVEMTPKEDVPNDKSEDAAPSESQETAVKKGGKQSKKEKKEPKKKKVASAGSLHPKYSVMITAAISALKDRSGSSRQAILKAEILIVFKTVVIGGQREK